MKTSNSDKIRSIQRLLSETNGNTLDVLYVIYTEFLKDADMPSELLQVVLEFPERIGKNDGMSEKISADVEVETKEKYLEYIKSTVSVLVKANNPVDVFYRNLWEMIFGAPTAPRSAEQSAVILMILCEDIVDIPYYQAKNILSMTNDDFRNRLEKLVPLVREAFHMMTPRFSQRTEATSQIYRLMQDLSREDACVFLAVVFDLLQNRA